MSLMTFPELSSDRQLPRAPHDEVATSGDFSSELSPPRSPQLKSTARDPPSAPKQHPDFSSSESSPQPEKINLEDLTGILPEPGHIPELLLDTAVPLSEEAPDGPTVPRPQTPQDLPEALIDAQGQAVPQSSGEFSLEEDKEDEEQRWERERKEKQERRQRELEEARERELQELERLEIEMLSQEVEQPRQEEEEETGIKEGGEEEAENAGEKSKGENPLEKYMKMVLEAREKQHAQNPEREEAAHMSPEAKSLFEEKDDSIAAYSHKDEDDDFW